MGLSRKRKKELKRLKHEANELWGAQQDLLNHANAVAKEASRQLGNFGRETVVPAAAGAYAARVAPVVGKGALITKGAVEVVKKGVDARVVPVLGGVVGSALAVGDVAKDKRVQAAVKRLHLEKYAPAPAKSAPGAGTIVAIGLGVLAAAGVAYAAWQTFRADDELWVADDEPILPNA
ncbi:DNA helicase [Labedella phragmitis]|uniref:DNA helicase n=1 Tax=Labedella phragmitis TaxID=2498849 RepID=A0A444PXI9_9MICO|nr:DNA helicase [Labedella phragmitis]RWZ52619.1 DNA helicase [Labedella phragmitis]